MTYALAILGILLALSAAGNAWQFKRGEAMLEAKATAEQLNRDTKAAASACSAGVDRLDKAGAARQKRLEDAMATVAPKVAILQEASLVALSARPDNAQDLCGSLTRYLQREIKTERGAK